MTEGEVHYLIKKVDDVPGILDYKLSNKLCCWILVRHFVFTQLVKQVQRSDAKSIAPSGQNRIMSTVASVKDYLNAMSRDPLSRKKKYDCLNFCSSVASVSTPQGFENRITGFLNRIESISTLHILYSEKGKYPKVFAGDYAFFDALGNRLRFASKLNRAGRQKAKVIDGFVQVIRSIVGDLLNNSDYQKLKSYLEACERSGKTYDKIIRKLLVQTSPRMVIIEDGNYGHFQTCSIVKVAREMGIPTVEFQHGVLDLSYQYSEALRSSSELASHKTDYLLTFGEFSSNVVKSTSCVYAIGYSYLEEKAASYSTNKDHSSQTVLFITQLNYTDLLIPMLEEALGNLLYKPNLIIRLHPLDSGHETKYKNLVEKFGGAISKQEDLYAQLNDADYIIGMHSTVLFEALQFRKRPFIVKTSLTERLMPENLGPFFSNGEELRQLLSGPPPVIENELKEYYWKSGVVDNFRKFYADKIISKDRRC